MLSDPRAVAPPPRRSSTAWRWLVAVNVLVFLVERWLDRGSPALSVRLSAWFHLLPGDVADGKIWQLLTFQFLHVNLSHLLLNCLGLYFFGQPVGESYGGRAVWRLYLICGVLGGLAHCVLGWIFPTWYGRIAVVGASAGVYGLVGAFCWIHWLDRFQLGLPGTRFGLPWSGQRLFVLFLVVGVLSMTDLKSRVAHDAHLGGLFAGLWFTQTFLWPKGSPRPASVKRS